MKFFQLKYCTDWRLKKLLVNILEKDIIHIFQCIWKNKTDPNVFMCYYVAKAVRQRFNESNKLKIVNECEWKKI